MKRFLQLLFIMIGMEIAHPACSQQYMALADLNGRYGFVDTSGYWIIHPKYESASSFSEGLAAAEYYGKWGYIDKTGHWIIQPEFSEAKPFSEGLACVKSSGKWGFIDLNGKWVLKPQFFAVSSFSEGKAVVYGEKGFYYIDKKQNNSFNSFFAIAKPFSEGMAYVKMDNQKGFIDSRGNWLFSVDFDEVYSYSQGLAMVMKSGKYGFINHRGDLVIPLNYKDATRFSEGLAGVRINKKWGYINKSGKVMIVPAYDYAGPFSCGTAVVRMSDKFGLINLSGKWILDPDYKDIGDLTSTVSLSEKITKIVKENFSKWETKGEFEKTQEYLKRVSEDNRQKEIDHLTSLAINQLARKSVKPEEAELGFYNADAEMFNIIIPGALPSLLPVPLSEARWVKENWDKIKFDSLTFTLSNDQFLITGLSAALANHHFNYDAILDGVPASNFDLTPDLGNAEITLPGIPVMIKNNQGEKGIYAGTSDVDLSIPVNPVKQSKTFAVVIGNEDYTSYQVNGGGNINVDYANADARTFKDYLTKTFGIPDRNITLLLNATAGQINQSLARLSALAKAYDGKAKLIFYYAGHGLPDEETREPYLIPVDVSASDLTYAVSLETVFNKLTENKSERVTVFLDACFSGGARSQGLVASRGIRIRPKSPYVNGNLVVFSAASEDETAYAYNEKGHGMFTYFLLKKFRDSGGSVSYGELAEYLKDEVDKNSLLINNREQLPEVNVSPALEDSWKSMTFIPNGPDN